MYEEPKFFVCEVCGNLVGMIHSSGVPMMCCGKKMTELKANTSDGAAEKHVPVVKQDGSKVTVLVGDVLHPMTEEHHIAWVYLRTEHGGQRHELCHDGKPEAVFCLPEGEKALAVYAYCNLHGLWKADVK